MKEVSFEQVEREVQRQVSTLYGADPATIRIASDRLRRMAEQAGRPSARPDSRQEGAGEVSEAYQPWRLSR